MTRTPSLGRLFAAAVAAAAVLVAAAAEAPAAPQVGREAPGFTATDSHGRTLALADYRGKTVVLEWTNHECPFVARHYGLGNMQALQKEATAEGVVWLSVISSAPGEQGYVTGDEANRLTESRGAAPTRVVLDPEGRIGRRYGAVTTPHMYVVDPSGTLVYMGGIDDDPSAWGELKPDTRNFVRLALNDLKAGRKIGQPVSRPYGCSVKYAF